MIENEQVAGHKILVKATKVPTQTAGGLYKPDRQVDVERAGNNVGVVLKVGPTAWKHSELGGDPWCKVGDQIRWPRYAGARFEEGDDDYFVINDEDVMLVSTIENENQ